MRARTLSVLQRLDGLHKRSVVEFLQEARLIDKANPVINLAQANLWYAELYELNLSKANFSGVDLYHANLSQADLTNADLTNATLLDTNLSGAILDRAELSGALMSSVYLDNANLTRAIGLIDDYHDETNDYLESVAHTLDNATMPNGQKYEDWLKSKGRRGDGENPQSPPPL